jgi:hypothetical protein
MLICQIPMRDRQKDQQESSKNSQKIRAFAIKQGKSKHDEEFNSHIIGENEEHKTEETEESR